MSGPGHTYTCICTAAYTIVYQKICVGVCHLPMESKIEGMKEREKQLNREIESLIYCETPPQGRGYMAVHLLVLLGHGLIPQNSKCNSHLLLPKPPPPSLHGVDLIFAMHTNVY